MKRLLLFILFVSIFTTAFPKKKTFLLSYSVVLSSVKLETDSITETNDSLITNLGDSLTSRVSSYVDENIEIAFRVEYDFMKFAIKNKTKNAMKFNWDDIVFINRNGQTSRVIGGNVKWIDKDKPQVPSVIPSGALLNDTMSPSNNFEYNSSSKAWTSCDLIDFNWFHKKKFKTEDQNFKSKRVDNYAKLYVYMPLVSGSKIYNYTFTFKVDKIFTVVK